MSTVAALAAISWSSASVQRMMLPRLRYDLFYVAARLFVGLVVGGDDDDGHILVDEGDGPVLHLACGICLGVDIGYLLELERPFHGDGVVDAPAEVEEVLVSACTCGQAPPCPSASSRTSWILWGIFLISLMPCRTASLSMMPSFFREVEHEEVEDRYLRGEGLGGGDADLRARVGEDDAVRIPGEGASEDVADGEGEDALLLCLFHDRDGVRGLTRLGDEEEHVVLAHYGVPVAELGRDIDLDGYAQVCPRTCACR